MKKKNPNLMTPILSNPKGIRILTVRNFESVPNWRHAHLWYVACLWETLWAILQWEPYSHGCLLQPRECHWVDTAPSQGCSRSSCKELGCGRDLNPESLWGKGEKYSFRRYLDSDESQIQVQLHHHGHCWVSIAQCLKYFFCFVFTFIYLFSVLFECVTAHM